MPYTILIYGVICRIFNGMHFCYILANVKDKRGSRAVQEACSGSQEPGGQ